MTLKERIDVLKEELSKKIPAEVRAKLKEAGASIEQTVQFDKILKKGDTVPDFVLKDEQGTDVNISDLCANGSVIISFYRGVW
ncbi:MAG: redoxin domain-containing protein [Desulfotalea sp.]